MSSIPEVEYPVVDNRTNLILSHKGYTFGEKTKAFHRQPCHNYSKNGKCPYGFNCHYIHSKLCIYYPHCSHGEDCQFLHYDWKTDTVRPCKNYNSKCHNFTKDGDLCRWCFYNNICEGCEKDLTIYKRCENESCTYFVPYKICDTPGCYNRTQFKYCYGCYNDIEDWNDPFTLMKPKPQKRTALPPSTTPTPSSTPVQTPRIQHQPRAMSYASVLVEDVHESDEKEKEEDMTEHENVADHMTERTANNTANRMAGRTTESTTESTVERTTESTTKSTTKDSDEKTDTTLSSDECDFLSSHPTSITRESYYYMMVPVPASSMPQIPKVPVVPSSIPTNPNVHYHPSAEEEYLTYFPPVICSPQRPQYSRYPPVFFPGTITDQQYYPDYSSACGHYFRPPYERH